ncbi:MAG TPA: UvrD-helicase domain-containing protein [Pirellulales bacterium]|nr:UvrD-helicase domain-containing protein [Pirellulales bacterium]
MSDVLDSLTPAQRQAVEHIDGPLLILAGPGSGKTRVVTHRIANLLRHGIAARQILALTFTNKAADEMKSRVERLAPGQAVWIGTFHRFCARLLRQYAPLVGLQENYTIYDTGDSAAVLRRACHEAHADGKHFTPQQVATAISWAKNNLILPDDYQPRIGQPLGAVVAKVYPTYQRRLLASNAVDFDDLLLHVATLLRANPELRETLDARYRYILVDEYQDTNLAQYAIVRALSVSYPNLSVTGDPDQSIYGWRGANINNILNFEHDFPNVHVVRLEQNYRSTKRILRVAAELISHNQRRKKKGLFTDNPEGPPVRYVAYPNQAEEADHIAAQIAEAIHSGRRRPSDFAIFYRVNALSRALEFALRRAGIPYQMVNGVEFYQRKEIKDVLAYLMLLNNPRDDMAFLRTVNTPPRGIGKSTLDRLADYATRRGKSLLEAAREAGIIEAIPKKAAVAVARFVALFDRLNLVSMRPVEEILGHVLNETGYQAPLAESGLEEDQERLANIQELLTAAREFDELAPGEGHLEEFLEEVCLINDVDVWEPSDDRVAMMTLHASKGLEFPCVYIVAIEEGILPHERAQNDLNDLEEERRLLFVGITRAEEELQLSLAQYREFRGRRKMSVPSKFLMELPRDELDATEAVWAEPAAALPDVHEWEDASPHDMVELHAHEDEVVWQPPEATENAGRGQARLPSLTTAAQLASAAGSATGLSPEAFHQGMVVLHPEYGIGKVVALSGSGLRRTATVAFATAGQRKFVLAQSPLQPLRQEPPAQPPPA